MSKFLKSVLACIVGAISGSFVHSWPLELFMPDLWQIWVAAERSYTDMPGLTPPRPRAFLIIPVVMVFSLLAIPTQAMLRRLRLNGYLPTVGLCILAGMVGGCLMAGSFDMTISQSLLFFGPIAFLSGSIAWLIRRPDKDGAP
jgi:hypothetical protein